MKERLMNNKGFTLIEVVVILVILAILMSFTAPSIFGYSKRARATEAVNECREVVTATVNELGNIYNDTGYRINDNVYPTEDVIERARYFAQVKGRVNNKWVRGNGDFVVSNLVYEYSDEMWVVYHEGDYYVYEGEPDTPADYLPDDGIEAPESSLPTANDNSKNNPVEKEEDDFKFLPTKAETTTTTETTTVTETTTETTKATETTTEAEKLP